MSSLTESLVVFAVVFSGAIAGMLLRRVLPEHHLSSESKDIVKLGTGMVATMAALVLGLLVASAKASIDAQSTELTQAAANIVLLDRVLAHYGPETKEIRDNFRSTVERLLEETWSREGRKPGVFGTTSRGSEFLLEEVQGLSPQNDLQRTLQSQAVNMVINLGQTRWLMFEQGASAVSQPLVVMMVFWLTIIFLSWGLFAPANSTVVVTLVVAALAVSGAIYLILEMYRPYQGLIQVSSAPLRAALAQLGR
jgi:hypothetical protein